MWHLPNYYGLWKENIVQFNLSCGCKRSEIWCFTAKYGNEWPLLSEYLIEAGKPILWPMGMVD